MRRFTVGTKGTEAVRPAIECDQCGRAGSFGEAGQLCRREFCRGVMEIVAEQERDPVPPAEDERGPEVLPYRKASRKRDALPWFALVSVIEIEAGDEQRRIDQILATDLEFPGTKNPADIRRCQGCGGLRECSCPDDRP
jgi:hypothetical protein